MTLAPDLLSFIYHYFCYFWKFQYPQGWSILCRGLPVLWTPHFYCFCFPPHLNHSCHCHLSLKHLTLTIISCSSNVLYRMTPSITLLSRTSYNWPYHFNCSTPSKELASLFLQFRFHPPLLLAFLCICTQFPWELPYLYPISYLNPNAWMGLEEQSTTMLTSLALNS